MAMLATSPGLRLLACRFSLLAPIQKGVEVSSVGGCMRGFRVLTGVRPSIALEYHQEALPTLMCVEWEGPQATGYSKTGWLPQKHYPD
jgi:hypothetical protein